MGGMTTYCGSCRHLREVRAVNKAVDLCSTPKDDPLEAIPYSVYAVLRCGHNARFITSERRLLENGVLV